MALSILIPIFSYLIGSLSLAPLVVRIQHRSILGSTGAANVAHLAGVKWGIAAGLFDFAKGFLPVFVSRLLGLGGWVTAASGLAAVVGHIWPVYFGFHGGRGLNTITGASILLLPRELPIAYVLGIGVGYAVRSSESMRSHIDPIAAGAAGALIGMILLSLLFREEVPISFYAIGAAILPMISGFTDMVAFFTRVAKRG